MSVTNVTENAKRKVDSVQAAVEAALVYPLLRGKDVNRWVASPEISVIMTHKPGMRLKAIPEGEMQRDYPKTWSYLKRFDATLRKSGIYRRFFKASDPFYSVFNVGDYTFARAKVVWREDRRRVWLRERLMSEVTDGLTLWAEIGGLFPNLRFCAEVESHLTQLDGAEPYFRQVVRHLFALELAARAWQEGAFEPVGTTWSDESEMTMTHGEFRRLRRMRCNGDDVVFRLHTKPTGGNVRIYFRPEHGGERIVLIGYVGPHLPTVRHRT